MPSRTWTPAAIERRNVENAKLRHRVITPAAEHPTKCWVPDCRKPSGAATPGLLGRFCKQHASHYRRHGSPLRPSYTGPETNPNRRAALAFLRANPDDMFVKLAIEHVRDRYRTAGIEVDAGRGTSTGQKADAVWARMREADVDPLFVLAAVAGVWLTVEADPQRPSSGKWGSEYRVVQVAKVIMRIAGGEVRRWASSERVADPITGRTERPPPRELRKFSASSGRVLRIVGKQAEEVADLLTYHMAAMRELAASLPVTKAARKTPWPDRQRAKPKARIPEHVKPTGSYKAREDARKQQQRERAEERERLALATIITPEQDAARQPKTKTLRNGVWIEDAGPDGTTPRT